MTVLVAAVLVATFAVFAAAMFAAIPVPSKGGK